MPEARHESAVVSLLDGKVINMQLVTTSVPKNSKLSANLSASLPSGH